MVIMGIHSDDIKDKAEAETERGEGRREGGKCVPILKVIPLSYLIT